MLRRLRTDPLVRAALAFALLLSVGAGFGLHPEPGSAIRRAPVGAGLSAVPAGAAPHGCLACLAHGLALPTPPAVSLAAVTAAQAPSPALEPDAPERLAGGPVSGRSPPANS
jgi:hypothetical protein